MFCKPAAAATVAPLAHTVVQPPNGLEAERKQGFSWTTCPTVISGGACSVVLMACRGLEFYSCCYGTPDGVALLRRGVGASSGVAVGISGPESFGGGMGESVARWSSAQSSHSHSSGSLML